MSGLFSLVHDGRSALYRLKGGASKGQTAEGENRSKTLEEKVEEVRRQDAERARGRAMDMSAAMTALEESRRINNPKAAAEMRMQAVERRLHELRTHAQLAAARGDAEVLQRLAKEAAMLAREAGRAARDFAEGVKAAAESGRGGGRTITVSASAQSTVVQIQTMQTRVDFSMASGGTGAGPVAMPPLSDTAPEDPVAGAKALAGLAEGLMAGDPKAVEQAAQAFGLSPEILAMALGGPEGNTPSADPRARGLMGKMAQDNEARLSRYKEADAFANRITDALATIRRIFGEAARALDRSGMDDDRRAEHRKQADRNEKELGKAEDEVNDLRAAALGSTAPVEPTPSDGLSVAAEALAGLPGAAALPTGGAATAVVDVLA